MPPKKRGRIDRREFLKKTARTAALAVAASSTPSLLSGCSGAGNLKYDFLIKNGTVYDGTSAEPRTADVGLKDGRIAAVGRLLDPADGGQIKEPAAGTVDASGLIVTPGLIDVHTHCDLTFQRLGLKRYLAYFMPSWKGNHNYLYQGVTTVVTGNCGYGYTDADYWFDLVQSVGFGTNVYHLAPHGMIREELFGASQPGELSASQLEAMKARVAEEMDKGAIGLSAGLEYAPGLMASTKEIIELAKVAGKKGGLFAVHMRDESGQAGVSGKIGLLEAIKEAIEVARRAELPVEISHLKIARPFGSTTPAQVLDLIEKARLEGLDLTADQYPYEAGSTMVTILLPGEFTTSVGVKEEYKTAAGRVKIKAAIEQVFAFLAPEKTLITMYPGHEEYEGKNLQEIARMQGRSPADAYVDMACEPEAPVGVFFMMEMNTVKALSGREYIITASDGWTVPKDMTKPHPRVYGTFPRKLRRFALDDKLMPLTAAIRSMTSLPARKFKMKDRGRIEAGAVADVAVFDLKTIQDRATYQNPHQYAAGLAHLFVAGEQVVENGRATGRRAGRPLRRA
ncbi:MAG: amidohydrolase family protein [Thermodesulfobacteriota bacterium]